MEIKKEFWGKAPDGTDVHKYILTNASGATVVLSDVGASIISAIVPDKDGKMEDVVLSYKDAISYFGDGPCMGKCPGRFANRIAAGKFSLDGKDYTLAVNCGPNHLHGGPGGFMNRVWESRIENDGVEFMYFSQDGEEGYPGNLKTVIRYEWDEENALKITFTAQCDAPTVINLTNHAYFNLDASGDIKEHVLTLNASEFLPTDDSLIPLGESVPVAGTPMDFVNPKALGRDLFADFDAVKFGKGYDNCWVIDGYEEGQIQNVAELVSNKSGRVLKVLSTQPGVQVYTGNWLEGCPVGKNGVIYNDYDGVAIECQHFPDSPNQPDYPTTVLRPGETYEQAIIYAFSTVKSE